MARVKDMTGMKFGRLTVVKESGRDKHGNTLWLCKCECGNETIVRGTSLRNGRTTSCGCYKDEMTSKKFKEKWQDEEFRQMQSELSSKKFKEKWQDEEFRQMRSNEMREMVKEKWQDEEFRQMKKDKAREQMKKQWKDEEFRQMKSGKMKEKWNDEEFRKMHSDKMRELWKDEDTKWIMGYKGGITQISEHLRRLPVVKQWKKDTYIRENYRCQLTNKQVRICNGDVHHLKAFNKIVLEAHELHNIEIHETVGEYTQEELYKLEQYIEKWHKDTSNAVLLCKEVHKLFHVLYKYGNNTPEQFEEFKQRYLSGEFEENIK